MASEQAVQFANFFAALRARSSNPDLDLPTIRDVVEMMHLATKEPEGVTYAEEDAGGVEALWCIPAGSGARTESFCTTTWVAPSPHRCIPIGRPPHTSLKQLACDRLCSTTGGRRKTSFQHRSKMSKRRITGCSTTVIGPRTSPASGTRSAATSPSALP